MNKVYYEKLIPKDILKKYHLIEYPDAISIIPKELITPEMCVYVLGRKQEYINYIPKDVFTNEMLENIIKLEPGLISIIPTKYHTKKMWEIAFSLKPFLIIYAKPEFITENICQDIAKKHISLIRYIPKKYAKQGLYNYAVKNNPKAISEVPLPFINQELCNYAVNSDITLIDAIPKRYINDNMRKNALSELQKYKNPILIKYVDEDKITIEMCIYAISSDPNLIKYIPKKYITANFIINMIEKFQYESYFRIIPFNDLNKEEREKVIEKILNINPELIEKYVPKKYITSHLAHLLVAKSHKLINYIPEEFITEEMLKKININDITKTEKIEKLIDNQIQELEILKDLTIMISSGGTIESLSKKYNLPLSKISEIIENQKDINPELYTAIKNKLLSNQAIWINNMIKDCNTINKIIISLGTINNAFLSREQKIKFAYLYNNHCSNSLEEIYSFANRYQDKIDNINTINSFFRNILKYNYLKNDTTLLPERKTILFNNKWLNPFNKTDYFKIKDGIPTTKNQYLEHIITINDIDIILNTLKSNHIPLNDMIVKEAIREFYDNTIIDYINKLQQYDSEIIENNKSRD